jgi:hypothetical protein
LTAPEDELEELALEELLSVLSLLAIGAAADVVGGGGATEVVVGGGG